MIRKNSNSRHCCHAKTYLFSAVNIIFLLAASINFSHAGEPLSEPILRVDIGEHTAAIKSIATDVKGLWLVTASEDKTARIWSMTDGRLTTTLRPPIGSGNEGGLNAVAISPDGQIVAVAGWTQFNNGSDSLALEGMNIYLFERASGRLIRRIPGLPNTIIGLDFSPNGLWLAATMGGTNGLYLFATESGQLLAKDNDYGDSSYSVNFDPTQKNRDAKLITTSYDGMLRLYRFNGQDLVLLHKKTPNLTEGKSRFSDAKFSPSGKNIVVGIFQNDSPSISVLDGNDLRFLYSPNMAGIYQDMANVAWSPDGSLFYAAGNFHSLGDNTRIQGWEMNDKTSILQSHSLTSSSSATIFSISSIPNGNIAFGSVDSAWGVLDETGKKIFSHLSKVADLRGGQSNFKLSPNATQVRFGYKIGGVASAIFDIQSRVFLRRYPLDLAPPLTSVAGVEVTDWAGDKIPKINGVPLALKQEEQSFSAALSLNGDLLALGTGWYLKLFDRKGTQLWQQAAPAAVFGVNISTDGRFVVAAYGDGTIRWHRASDGIEQLAFFPHADKKRWIMWTPEGYYDASSGGEDLIGWHLNQGKDKEARFIPSGQLYDVFFRPDIVQAKFRGDDISSLITITAAQALKYPPPVLSFTKIPGTTKSNTEKVCYKAVATGGGIGEVRLFQNGKLIKSDGFYREGVARVDSSMKLASVDSATVSRALKLTKTAQKSEPPMASNSKGNEYSECQDIETIPGDNEISVAAFNANNTIQGKLETSHFTSERKAEAPHLYVLGIGIDKYNAAENNLHYAVKDATDFRSMIRNKAQGLFDTKNIHVSGLSDAKATKAGIQQAIAAISAKVKPWDSFVLFVASHGYLQDNQYYIVTSDFDGAIDTSKMISSNEIVGMSKNIKSLSQLLIFDTCHAGGVDNIIGGLYDARMSVMAKKMGLHIYASAGSTQTALDGYQGNGLFTHALLNSMKAGTTDSNHDNEVSVAELGESAKLETLEISTKLGFPQSPNIINFGKDVPLFGVK